MATKQQKKPRKRPVLTLSHDIKVSKALDDKDGARGDKTLAQEISSEIERFPESVTSDFSSVLGKRKRFGI